MQRSCALLLLLAGCSHQPPEDVTFAEGPIRRYVVNKLQLPMQRAEYALDLNGDTRADNQLGNLIGALASQKLDIQRTTDESVATGSLPLLIALQASDLDQADHAGLTIQLGLPHAMPDFSSGDGHFQSDGRSLAARLYGTIRERRLGTNNPVSTTHPVSFLLPLPLFAPAAPLLLPLEGAHLQLKTGIDSASGKPGLIEGEIHGSVSREAIDEILIPAMAHEFTRIIDHEWFLFDMKWTYRAMFDTGGCMGAYTSDGIIDPCEVATNQIIINVLAPDVQIHDPNGNYAPDRNNARRDSLSIGIGFTAVAAQF